jgi:hypothetical protein
MALGDFVLIPIDNNNTTFTQGSSINDVTDLGVEGVEDFVKTKNKA